MLAQPGHAASGLMRAEYDPVAAALRHPASMRLDAKGRARLRERLALAAQCR